MIEECEGKGTIGLTVLIVLIEVELKGLIVTFDIVDELRMVMIGVDEVHGINTVYKNHFRNYKELIIKEVYL